MPRPGRKPIDLRHLDQLDRESFKAFHRLCKGVAVPVTLQEARTMVRLAQRDTQAHKEDLQALRGIGVQAWWADFNGDPKRADDLETATVWKRELEDRYAESIQGSIERENDLASVIQELNEPKNARKRLKSYEVWRRLWQATSGKEVEQACSDWMALPGRYRDDLVSVQVIKHADTFLSMLNNERFPRSASGDDARITYLARGTAGLFIGISPLTAIERLRKISHKRGHPLFMRVGGDPLMPTLKAREPRKVMCMCWRCALQRRRDRGAIP